MAKTAYAIRLIMLDMTEFTIPIEDVCSLELYGFEKVIRINGRSYRMGFVDERIIPHFTKISISERYDRFGELIDHLQLYSDICQIHILYNQNQSDIYYPAWKDCINNDSINAYRSLSIVLNDLRAAHNLIITIESIEF